MGYKIAFKASVARDLKKVDRDQAKRILARVEEELPEKAEALPTLKGQFSGLRKFRVGDYRVIYTILGDTALVLRIGHRSSVYR
ncbi:MAG: type II toxin-antitoxin system RelE/ParE family toxin [Thermodesulfobacteriota bacterium]|nr:type II toxin-antitoxin system RelE/ParE family toxin [Thermodesulfobacteriota bacterium]